MTIIISLIKKLLRKKKVKTPPIDAKFIIPRNHHNISKTDISFNALKVLNRLTSAGYQAYLVGGSVRDLLLHKSPKDFDIATNATPNDVKRLFRNARIIGRRFKLAHILFHREIIEVATFRKHEPSDDNHQMNDKGMVIRDNVYGSIEEDAWRRDFSVNSLYYNIEDASIIDFTDGVKDIRSRFIRIIGDPNKRYQEDPVRMLRAIRFSAKLHFELEEQTEKPLYEFNHLINHISGSRLFDEMIKLYQSGEACAAQNLLLKYGLFAHLFPQTNALISNPKYPIKAFIGMALENTDIRIRETKPVNPAFLYAVFLWFPMRVKTEELIAKGTDTLPAIEQAMSLVLHEQNKIIQIPKRFSQVIREIWFLQYRFPKRLGNRAYHLLEHPRFRAAYDFLYLRALASDESLELSSWWTKFQEVDDVHKAKMISELKT